MFLFQQRNLKQRFIALLKRFKVPEALQAFDQDQELDPRTGKYFTHKKANVFFPLKVSGCIFDIQVTGILQLTIICRCELTNIHLTFLVNVVMRNKCVHQVFIFLVSCFLYFFSEWGIIFALSCRWWSRWSRNWRPLWWTGRS